MALLSEVGYFSSLFWCAKGRGGPDVLPPLHCSGSCNQSYRGRRKLLAPVVCISAGASKYAMWGFQMLQASPFMYVRLNAVQFFRQVMVVMPSVFGSSSPK